MIQFDFKKFIWMLVFLTIASLFLFLSSCSPEYHKEKFIKKGGLIKCDTTFVDVPVIVKGKDGKDSLIYVNSPVDCPELISPEPRWKIKHMDRVERKRFQDSLKHIESIYKDSLKYALKTHKNNNKANIKQNQDNKKYEFKTEKAQTLRWYHYTFWIVSMIIAFIIGFSSKEFINNIKNQIQ